MCISGEHGCLCVDEGTLSHTELPGQAENKVGLNFFVLCARQEIDALADFIRGVRLGLHTTIGLEAALLSCRRAIDGIFGPCPTPPL